MINKQEIMSYASILNTIGDSIKSIGNNMRESQFEKISIQHRYAQLKSELVDYIKAQRELETTPVPEVINKEHGDLIDAYKGFIDGTEAMMESISSLTEIDKDKYNKGLQIQKSSVANLLIVVQKIGDKLIAYLQ